VGVPDHVVSAIVDGIEITGWSAYNFEEALELASPWSMTMPFRREVWDLVRPDRTIQIFIDGAPKLNGYIDGRDKPLGEEVITISGRDRSGRIVQDSAPGVSFAGLGIIDITKALIKDWGFTATFTNDRNRAITLGHGRKAKGHRKRTGSKFTGKARQLRGSDEALRLNSRVGTKIEPGQTRGQVITTLATQAGYLVWPSCDGREIIVGEPDYDQDIQFVFFHPKEGSERIDEASCLGMGVKDDTGDMYSRVIVVGAGSGTDANYGSSVASRYAETKDNPSDPEGVGKRFTAPKRLILSRPVQSTADAQELADREFGRREAQCHMLTVRAAGHGQIYDGDLPTLFAPDTLALCEDEETGTAGIYLITKCTFQSSREGGEETLLTLVKSGSELTQL
jgi:prophage tail gpP-like protein